MGQIVNLNKNLEKWAKEYLNIDIDVIEGGSFHCRMDMTAERNAVAWDMFDDPATNENFITYLRANGLALSVADFCAPLAFLHEIGHIFTFDKFDERARMEDFFDKMFCPGLGDKLGYEADEWYWNLPIERAANEWVIKWVNENYEAYNALCFVWYYGLYEIGKDQKLVDYLDELGSAWDNETIEDESFYDEVLQKDQYWCVIR